MQKSELKRRWDLWASCEGEDKASLEARSCAVKLCKDPENGIIYFFENWLWTYDPRKKPSELPFKPWEYQTEYLLELNNDIREGIPSLTEKSRDMGATWMILGTFVYRFLFFDENFLVGSRKAELVDTTGEMATHFERMRFMINKLPKWMIGALDYDIEDSAYMRIYRAGGASITGESMNQDFSRQGRYNAILLDEFAFVQFAETIWRATGDSTPCRIVISTPHGSNNKFAELRKSGKIKVYSLHWTKHPEKDDEWYAKQKAERSDKDVAQEIDINYTISAGDPFYSGFKRALHFVKMIPNKEKELVLTWDYGWGHPNCLINQITVEGIWLIVDNIFGQNQTIDEFADFVAQYLGEHYSDFYLADGYGDPAGKQSSDKSRKTSEQILNEYGFKVSSVPSNTSQTNYAARKVIIEKKLRTLIGGIPALVVRDCPNNEIIAEAFEGGYRFPDANKYGGIADKPVDDGYFEHCLAEGTLVRTLSGWVKIEELVGKTFTTYAYSEDHKRLVPAEATDCRMTQENVELWKLEFDTGELIATPDHLIMKRDGSFVELQELKEDDELMPFYETKRSSKGHTTINLNDGSIVDEHRYIYSWFNGNLREKHHIHHIDENPSNNNPDNLQQMLATEHMAGVYAKNRIKRTIKGGCVHDWGTDSRKKVSFWSKKHHEDSRVEKKCEVCGSIYMGTPKQKYCCKRCGYRAQGERRRLGLTLPFKAIKKCVNCGKEFEAYVHSKFCSIACGGQYRRKQRKLELVNHKVVSVSHYGYGNTYNLEVEKYHNFPANGIIVHNCMNCLEYFAVNRFRLPKKAPTSIETARRRALRRDSHQQNAGFSFRR